jgi:hypothetical protein
MSVLQVAPRPAWGEWLLFTLLAAGASAWLYLQAGYFGWSWDALNHHVYLGFIAESPRWDLDVAPASVQSYQHPYLYWPIYRLSLLEGNGATIGALWSAFQAVLVLWPLWALARALLPDRGPTRRDHLQGVAWRGAACALGFSSAIVFTALETTSNDLLASVPLLWAMALGVRNDDRNDRTAALAALLWGVSVGLKLSNGLFLPVLLALWWMPRRPHWRLRRAGVIALAATAGFAAVYAPWGWKLWQLTGNPFFPLLGSVFGGR